MLREVVGIVCQQARHVQQALQDHVQLQGPVQGHDGHACSCCRGLQHARCPLGAVLLILRAQVWRLGEHGQGSGTRPGGWPFITCGAKHILHRWGPDGDPKP